MGVVGAGARRSAALLLAAVRHVARSGAEDHLLDGHAAGLGPRLARLRLAPVALVARLGAARTDVGVAAAAEALGVPSVAVVLAVRVAHDGFLSLGVHLLAVARINGNITTSRLVSQLQQHIIHLRIWVNYTKLIFTT